MDAADAYLLDLCDAALGEVAQRGAELPWLREGGEPEGPPVRVDGWYPQTRLVVLLTDTGGDERARALARAAAGYGVDVFEVRRGWIARDAEGRPRRLPAEGEMFRQMLGDPEERELNKVGVERGWTAYAYPDWGAEEEWPDDELVDAEHYAAEPAAPPAMQPEAELDANLALGWRGRSVTLALLEAVRLGRRAFAVERTGEGLPAEALEALLVLFVAGRPVEPDEVGRLLARDEAEALDALELLREAGAAEALGHPEEAWEWSLTPAGREVAETWIARVAPLLAGWPPDVPGVDDAGGPAPA